MRHLTKKSITLVFTLIMMICLSVSALAADRDPRQILAPPTISVSAEEVESLDQVMVTISFRETVTRQVPFTIELTDGAIFPITDSSDIVFTANGTEIPITSYNLSADGTKMELVTGTTVRSLANTITFPVEAPILATKFQVLVKTDSANPNLAFREIWSEPIRVISGLTINAPDVINDFETFDIWGTASYRKEAPPENSTVFIEIVNIDEDKPQFLDLGNGLYFDQPVVDGEYRYQGIDLPTYLPDGVEQFEDGEYIIRVYLLDADYNTIGYGEKQVTFEKKKDFITINAPSVISSNQPFDISGIIRYQGGEAPKGSTVFLEILNAAPNKPQFLTLGKDLNFDQAVSGGDYIYPAITLPSLQPDGVTPYEDGDYIIRLYVLGPDYETIAISEQPVVFQNK